MEDSNHIYTTNTQPTSQPTAKKSPMEMVKLGFAQIGNKLKINNDPKALLKKVAEFGGIFLGIIMLLVVAWFAFRVVKQQIAPAPVATAQPTLAPIVQTPSPNRYANDPDVIKLNADSANLDSELSRIDIGENNLKPRPFNWDINFK